MAYLVTTKDKRQHVVERSFGCTTGELPRELCSAAGIELRDLVRHTYYTSPAAAHALAETNNKEIDGEAWKHTTPLASILEDALLQSGYGITPERGEERYKVPTWALRAQHQLEKVYAANLMAHPHGPDGLPRDLHIVAVRDCAAPRTRTFHAYPSEADARAAFDDFASDGAADPAQYRIRDASEAIQMVRFEQEKAGTLDLSGLHDALERRGLHQDFEKRLSQIAVRQDEKTVTRTASWSGGIKP